jgi:serpin B
VKRTARAAILVVIALLAAGCGSDTTTTAPPSAPSTGAPSTAPPTPPTTESPTEPTMPRGGSIEPVALADRQPATESPATAGEAVRAFGFDVFAAAAGAAPASDNVVVSPLSIAIALAMLEPGASSDATTELRDLLHIDDAATWHASMNALEQQLESRRPDEAGEDQDPGELHADIANAAFIQPGYAFDPDYLDTVGSNYGAVIEELDFLADQAAAADRINEFIADATDDRITDLVGEDAIDPRTVLALVNALVLQASWQSPFVADATVDDDFTRLDGSTVTLPLMHGRSDASGRGDGWVAATKRLVGRLGIEIVLPDEGRFEEIASRYPDVVAEYATGRRDGAELVMPNFETRVTTDLTDVLVAMGLTAPFETGNLMAIANDPMLVLDRALHETWLSIDEDGIEAAAATVLLMMATSAPVEEPVAVVLDRPFLFRIVDDVSGATLFVGRIMDPTA